MKESRAKTINSTLAEKWAMKALMDEHLHPIKDTNYFCYDEDWNDEKVSKTVNPAFNAAHARFVRMEMFGKIRGWSKSPSDPLNLETRITILEAKIKELESLFLHKNKGTDL